MSLERDWVPLESSGSSHHPHRMEFAERTAPITSRVGAAALVGAVAGAVVAFGGTDQASFAAVEILLFVLAACGLWIAPREGPRFGWLGPSLLLAFLACDVAIVRPAEYLALAQSLAVVACVCGFFLAALVARDSDARHSISTLFVALGFAEALYGVVQYAAGWQQVLAFKKVDYFAEATGTYINPNNFAGLLEMLLPLVFARTLCEFEKWTGNSRGRGHHSALWFRANSGPRFAFFLFGTLLVMTALLLSRSRAGISAACVGLMVVASFWVVRSRSHSAAAAIVLCLLALTFAGAAWVGLGPVFGRFRSTGQDLPSRIAVWRDTSKLIRAHPYWGTGPGSFEDAYTRVQTSHLATRLNRAHNDYLEFTAEWGVPGAALLFASIGFVLIRAFRGLGRTARADDWFFLLGCVGSAISLLLHSLVDFNLHIPANALLFAVLLGLAATLSRGDATTTEPRVAQR